MARSRRPAARGRRRVRRTGDLHARLRDHAGDAVAASCAVPGVWPPVSINGHRYMDGGGVRSLTNADLAAGCDRILVITPTPADAPQPWGNLDDEIELLKPGRAQVVHVDPASLAAFGTNPLSPATRAPAARAGREIGQARAADLALFWN
jgi:NTE family protein